MAARTELKLLCTYLKDLSFQNFKDERLLEPGVSPELSINVGVRHTRSQSARHFEAVLTVDVTANLEGEKIYDVEVQQGGLFEFTGEAPGDQLAGALAWDCPVMLFPFARETVSAAVSKGGFPGLVLRPSICFVPSPSETEPAAREQVLPSGEPDAHHDATDS